MLVYATKCSLVICLVLLSFIPSCRCENLTSHSLRYSGLRRSLVPSNIYSTAHCGKKFRIATHHSPPLINIDTTKCINQLCPSTAFVNGGGLTYQIMNNEVLTNLKSICKANGLSTFVVFEWYIPRVNPSSPDAAVEMVCQGSFSALAPATINTTYSGQRCAAAAKAYNGPSITTECASIGDPTCASPGPDLVAGAIPIASRFSDLLAFTTSYYQFQQHIVKRPIPPQIPTDGLVNVFLPFTGWLWGAILLECIAVFVSLLVIESPYNTEHIRQGKAMFFDTWYWVICTLCASPDKDAFTVGGRIVYLSHLFFGTLITATYTGAIAAFLTQQAVVVSVQNFQSFTSGQFSTVVVGPSWNPKDPQPPYLGKFIAGTSTTTKIPYDQFNYLQTVMQQDPKITISIYTADRVESAYSNGQPLLSSTSFNPCKLTGGASYGIFDMVECGKLYPSARDGSGPDALFYDGPVVYNELNSRYSRTGKCALVTIGDGFHVNGYSIGFPYSSVLSRPFNLALLTALEDGAMETYLQSYGLRANDVTCTEVVAEGGNVMDITEIWGLFALSSLFLIAAFSSGIFSRLKEKWKAKREAEALKAEAEARALKLGVSGTIEQNEGKAKEEEEKKEDEEKKEEKEEEVKEEEVKDEIFDLPTILNGIDERINSVQEISKKL